MTYRLIPKFNDWILEQTLIYKVFSLDLDQLIVRKINKPKILPVWLSLSRQVFSLALLFFNNFIDFHTHRFALINTWKLLNRPIRSIVLQLNQLQTHVSWYSAFQFHKWKFTTDGIMFDGAPFCRIFVLLISENP